MSEMPQLPLNAGPKPIQNSGRAWIESVAKQWDQAKRANTRFHKFDLSDIRFVGLFEWVTFIAMVDKLAEDVNISEIGLDVVGRSPCTLLSQSEYIDYIKGRQLKRLVREIDFDFSHKLYKFCGFLESLGTLAVLNRPRRGARVAYPRVSDPGFKAFHAQKSEFSPQTVVLGLTRIEHKDDCRQFLDEDKILNWTSAMADRFRNSPLFASEELWRVLCHELAVNIWEHARTTGFIAGRVVSPHDKKGDVYDWCASCYEPRIVSRFAQMRSGFLELCVADAGGGFLSTLSNAYRQRRQLPTKAAINAHDVLAFAFDEIGTSKNENTLWITERHALGRILLLVGKYGGMLTLRSDGAEVVYESSPDGFNRIQSHLGYQPSQSNVICPLIPGSQLQLIIPLMPVLEPMDAKRQRPRSHLLKALPSSFQLDPNHVQGHLVPLLEQLDCPSPRVGSEERSVFLFASKKLCETLLLSRPAHEALVLDFGGLRWNPDQFETFLYVFQNLLQWRPVLLVEVWPQLVRGVKDLEVGRATTSLTPEVVGLSPSTIRPIYNEVSESKFLETYARVHCTLLGVSELGEPFILGLPNPHYERALLNLIRRPLSIEDLCKSFKLEEWVVRGILTHANKLFQVHEGNWRTTWDSQAINNEAHRSIARHFQRVVEVNRAWRGQPCNPPVLKQSKKLLGSTITTANEVTDGIFNLPWDDRWASSFLECSRILSRSRYADEAAQRLIYRLSKWLTVTGRGLSEVGVLACATAPSILLANAIHRWWPETLSKPVVADLGYYLMLHPQGTIPALGATGGIVIVQDVLNRGTMSMTLIKRLQEQEKTVLCILALVQLVPIEDILKQMASEMGLQDPSGVRIDLATPENILFLARTTSVDEWQRTAEVPRHALVQVQRPGEVLPPHDDADDSNTFWIEPRTLHPIRYHNLRFTGISNTIVKTGFPDHYKHFFKSDGQPLIRSGHYAYGSRHYGLAIDVPNVFSGEIGDRIANWLADVCEGIDRPSRAGWESDRGFALKGNVTAILMPLHSQIYYLWPKLQMKLAQRGRRQDMWLLDATLFLGRGPAYRLPRQLERQMEWKVTSIINAVATGEAPDKLRILVLDDATATARTAGTIVEAIERSLIRCMKKSNTPSPENLVPIEWIRYFSVFNLLGNAERTHWHNLTQVGRELTIPFAFDEYMHCPGLPVVEEDQCPTCKDIVRLKHLISVADQYQVPEARCWLKDRCDRLLPTAIDNPENSLQENIVLPTVINVLSRKSLPIDVVERFQSDNADIAIWHLYELMYRSYPPNDMLRSLEFALVEKCTPTVTEAYERYRWAVFEWCIRNWRRVLADSARARFCEYVQREIRTNTPLGERLLDSCAQLLPDPNIFSLFCHCIERLKDLESDRDTVKSPDSDTQRSMMAMRLSNGMTLFLLNVLSQQLPMSGVDHNGNQIDILKVLRVASLPTNGKRRLTFLRQMYIGVTRPVRRVDPKWALMVVAESLYRGRDLDDSAKARHQLMPQLITDVLHNPSRTESRRLLEGSMALFMMALEDLKPHFYKDVLLAKEKRELPVHGDKLLVYCRTVLRWLRLPIEDAAAVDIPTELSLLDRALDPESPFCLRFNEIFHERIETIDKYLRDLFAQASSRPSHDRLQCDFHVKTEAHSCRVLTHVATLIVTIANVTFDPITSYEGNHRISICINRRETASDSQKLCFRCLTTYASLSDTRQRLSTGRSAGAEQNKQDAFGTEVVCQEPTSQEALEGFTAAIEIVVPASFATIPTPTP